MNAPALSSDTSSAALIAIVRHAAEVMREIGELGCDVLGLAGACAAGQPIIRIRPPEAPIALALGARRLWAMEKAAETEESHIGQWRGCWIAWTVVIPKTSHLGSLH
jgi:hypothetical protein